MEFLLLMLLYQIKHHYADFMIQSYEQTVRKGVYGDAVGISHSMDHVWTSLSALMIFSIFYPVKPMVIVAVSLIEGMLHYHIDWIKARYGTKNMTTPMFWGQFGLDQFAHQISYIAAIYLILL